MATQQTSDQTSGKNPHRMSLITTPENRDETTSRDARLVNGYGEKTPSGALCVYKRPGTFPFLTLTAGNGLGIFNWLGDIYSIIGSTCYKNSTVLGAVDSSGPYTFSSILGATPTLFFHNANAAYEYNTSVGLQGTYSGGSAPTPTPLVPGQAYLDATMYVMKPDAHIYGSNINAVDINSWNILNYLIAQIEPDTGVAIAKQLVYVIAFKQWSTEVFYDAANAAGSPLGTVQGAKLNVGCMSAGSVCDVEGDILWISSARSGNVGVMLMNNLKSQQVSTPAVERLLQQANYVTVWSFGLRIGGHRFYVVTLKLSNLTLVYDLTTGLWSQWTDTNGNYFPFVGSTFSSTNQVLLLHETSGVIYEIDQVHYTDNGALITVDIIAPNYDGGTRKIKFLSKLDIIADQTAGSTLLVRNSDDDYKTWSNFRQVDLNRRKPYLVNCGSFYQRAYHFRHAGNCPFRIEGVELQIETGSI